MKNHKHKCDFRDMNCKKIQRYGGEFIQRYEAYCSGWVWRPRRDRGEAATATALEEGRRGSS
jgi:hypothetical protein